MNLHPKIKAAAFAALAAGVVAIANAAFSVYPNNALVGLLYAAAPVVAGYLKSA